MRAAVLRGPGLVRTEQWPRPRIGAGELLLRLRGCGLCGSDLAKIFHPAPPVPAVLGHEVVGEVVEVGVGVAGFVLGDRVVAAHHVPCGQCHYCRRGHSSMCRTFKASSLDPGGFAELIRVPAAHVAQVTFRLPAHVDDETASFVEPLGCCLRAMRRLRPEPGDTALVVGLGAMGCLFLQLLAQAGARTVGLDRDPRRVALARRFGPEAHGPEEVSGVVGRLSEGRGADVVVITGGGAAVLPEVLTAVRDGGVVHYFAGGPESELPVALDTLYRRELTITATYSSSPADLREALRLLAEGHVRVDGLYTHRVPLERLGEGAELARSRAAVKVYVTP